MKQFIKTASSTSDIIIFLFLGIALVSNSHHWHVGFIVWTLVFCIICRFVIVYGLVWLTNKYRVNLISMQETFIMAYGGLRGAVGFSLVEMINSEEVPAKSMFVTTTLVVVMFTIFFQVSQVLKSNLNLDFIKSKK